MKKIKEIKKSLDNISKRKISIQFSLGGFAFCISNLNKEPYYLSSYEFYEINTPQKLLLEIQQIFEVDKNLQYDFECVEVIHQNELNTFVPKEFFKEELLTKYLEYNIKNLPNDLIVFDEIESLNLINVYIPYVNINNYFFQNFGEFDFKHKATILVEKLSKYINKIDTEVFASIENKLLEIIIFKDGEFKFYNSFNIYSSEDFIYYLLFVFEQLNLDTEKTKVECLGEININSDYFKLVSKHFKNVGFVEIKIPLIDNSSLNVESREYLTLIDENYFWKT